MIQFKQLTAEDVPVITQIEAVSRPTPWSEKQFLDELNNSNSNPAVLWEDDQIIGYVIPWLVAGEIQIQNIVVAPPHRKRGLGELLLNVALSRGLEQGCTAGYLEVRESNKPAIGLYQKYRFQTAGRREGYYRDGENALLMNLGPFESPAELETYQRLIENRANLLQKKVQFEIVA